MVSECREEDERTLKVVSRWKIWDVPSLMRLISRAIAFEGLAKGVKERTRHAEKRRECWWWDGHIYRPKRMSLTMKCNRVCSHVFGTVLNGSVNWPWSMERVLKVKRCESKILRPTLNTRMKAGEDMVNCRKRTSKEMRAKWRKMKLQTMAEKNAQKIWKTMAWADRGVMWDIPIAKWAGEENRMGTKK